MPKNPGQGAAAVAAADDDVDAIWNEEDANDGFEPAEAEPETEAAAEEEPATEEAEAAAEPEEADDDDWSKDDEPTPAPAKGAAEKSKPAGAAAPASKPDPAPQEPDIWAGASPEIIAARDKMRASYEGRLKSDAGRVAAYQRQAKEAKEALAALRAERAQQAAEPDPDLEAAEQEYPEVVKPLMKQLKATQDRLGAMEHSAADRERERAEAYALHVETETAVIEAEMPGYLDLISDPTEAIGDDGKPYQTREAKPEFMAWYRRQPADIREKVDRNANDITNAREAMEVLGAYKVFHDRFHAAVDPAAATAGSPATSHIAQKRQRQLRSAAAVTSRPQIGHSPGIPANGDPDAIWEAMDRQDAQEAARR